MLRKLEHGERVTAAKYNELAILANRLSKIRGSNGIDVRYSTTGINIVGQRKKAGAAESAFPAIIVKGLSYPDPTADPETPEYLGYDYYRVRLKSTGVADWEAGKEYLVGEKVTVENISYVSSVINTDIQPSVTAGWESYWTEDEELIIDRAIGNTIVQTDFDLRNYTPWFVENEEVLVIKLNDTNTELGYKYYLWQTLTYTGKPDESSLRFFTNRTRAVFA